MKKAETSTEEKILASAEKVFTEKGYAASRMRGIAEEAGINAALLNYYFRSKERLFQEVLNRKAVQLCGSLMPIFTDETSSLENKAKQIADVYIDLLLENPSLPLFVISEMKKNDFEFFNSIPLKETLNNSVIINQLKEANPNVNPLQFLLNLLSMCIFPTVAKFVFSNFGVMNELEFKQFMEERKKLIPKWFNAIITTN